MATYINEPIPYQEYKSQESQIEIEDFNVLINGIKKREENIIHVIDQTIKGQQNNPEFYANELLDLKRTMNDQEQKRQNRENVILSRYFNKKVTDQKNKKILQKLFSKITQLFSIIKDKLIQLHIYDQTRSSYKNVVKYQEHIKLLIDKQIVDVELVLNFIISHSRQRFAREVGGEESRLLERKNKTPAIIYSDGPKPKPFSISQTIDNNYGNGMTATPMNSNNKSSTGSSAFTTIIPHKFSSNSTLPLKAEKMAMSPRKHNTPIRSNQAQQSPELNTILTSGKQILHNKTPLSIKEISELKTKSIPSYSENIDIDGYIGVAKTSKAIIERPSPLSTLDIQNDGKSISVQPQTEKSNQSAILSGSSKQQQPSRNRGALLESIMKQASSVKSKSTTSNGIDFNSISSILNDTPKKSPKNLNSQSFSKQTGGLTSISGVALTISNQQQNQQTSQQSSLEDLSQVIKEAARNRKGSNDPWKPYDILRIENKPNAIGRRETKKIQADRIFNELMNNNSEIKRTLNNYDNTFQTFKKTTNNIKRRIQILKANADNRGEVSYQAEPSQAVVAGYSPYQNQIKSYQDQANNRFRVSTPQTKRNSNTSLHDLNNSTELSRKDNLKRKNQNITPIRSSAQHKRMSSTGTQFLPKDEKTITSLLPKLFVFREMEPYWKPSNTQIFIDDQVANAIGGDIHPCSCTSGGGGNGNNNNSNSQIEQSYGIDQSQTIKPIQKQFKNQSQSTVNTSTNYDSTDLSFKKSSNQKLIEGAAAMGGGYYHSRNKSLEDSQRISQSILRENSYTAKNEMNKKYNFQSITSVEPLAPGKVIKKMSQVTVQDTMMKKPNEIGTYNPLEKKKFNEGSAYSRSLKAKIEMMQQSKQANFRNTPIKIYTIK